MSNLYIGLMSGTSVDAIDAVLVNFAPDFALIETHSVALSEPVRRDILALCQSGADEIERMGRLDRELGLLFAEAANGVLAKSPYQTNDICAIGSHGQTIRHRPSGALPFTLQIGDPNTIAEKTGIRVVADFRRRDIAAGGQGAPLVPAFHADSFRTKECHRIVLNLGGIANITVLPSSVVAAEVYGFDTGPANMLMDAWIRLHKNLSMDKNGEWAASGNVLPELLERLLAHSFFALPAPKSTGREDFHIDWLNAELAAWGKEAKPEDVQATLLELTAYSVAQAVLQTKLESGELLMCGGGAFNPVLWARLQQLLPEWKLCSTADFGLAPNWVEATAFAWMARQTVLGLTGNLPSVTGAEGFRVLGGVYLG